VSQSDVRVQACSVVSHADVVECARNRVALQAEKRSASGWLAVGPRQQVATADTGSWPEVIISGVCDHLQRWFGQDASNIAVRKLTLKHGKIIKLNNACRQCWVDLHGGANKVRGVCEPHDEKITHVVIVQERLRSCGGGRRRSSNVDCRDGDCFGGCSGGGSGGGWCLR
jgi:hypothetical protein